MRSGDHLLWDAHLAVGRARADRSALAASFHALAGGLRQSFAQLGDALRAATFPILDLVIAATPVEDREPVSWEVERERFLRGLPGYDPWSES